MGGCSSSLSHSSSSLTSAPRSQGSTIRYSTTSEPKRKVIVIGVGGASCSGKSSLSEALAVHFASPLVVISGDWFFCPDRMPDDGKGRLNWEVPQGVDFELFLGELKRVIHVLGECSELPEKLVMETCEGNHSLLRPEVQTTEIQTLDDNPVVIVIEGFLLFYDAEIVPLCKARLWLDIDCATGTSRRWNRRQRKAKTKEGSKEFPPPATEFVEWYRDIVWFYYLKHKPVQMINANPVSINGLQSEAQILQTALEHISPLLHAPIKTPT